MVEKNNLSDKGKRDLALVEKARQLNCEAAVLVFEPQPQELFSPETAPARLCRLRDKYVLLKNCVTPELGKNILNFAIKSINIQKQQSLL